MSDDNFLPILNTYTEEINSRVLVCGDPDRAGKIADKLDYAREISYNREYRIINGSKNGKELTVASHGVGAAGAAVCFKELIKGGAKEIIRIGTAGSLKKGLKDGGIVIATAAVREDGLTDQLISPSYPAVASYKIVDRLISSARKENIETVSGIVLTLAAFYPELNELPNNYYSQAGVVAVEMEVSALFVLASLYGIEAGAVLAIDGMAIDFDADSYNPHRDEVDRAVDKEIDLAITALVS